MPKKKRKTFRERCTELAEGLDTEVEFYTGEIAPQTPFEDDGVLHVIQRGTRAAFGLDPEQEHPAEFNRKAAIILKALGHSMTERTTAEEDGEEDDSNRCPNCGYDLS